MAEVLETQEQFPVQAGIQDVDESIDNSWTPAFAGATNRFFNNLLTRRRRSRLSRRAI